MAQAVRRLGGEVALVEAAKHVLAREPAPLGEALGEVLRGDGIELFLGIEATAARRDGDDYVLTLASGQELRGGHLLVGTGRRPRMPDGLAAAGATFDAHGIHVDTRLRAGIQPFPTFSEIYVAALKALNSQIAAARQPDTAHA
jgi:pyruvate/2-oxoglutarate dehydrogenase complex dihydrolipoamide dehydrogenase (E3) component